MPIASRYIYEIGKTAKKTRVMSFLPWIGCQTVASLVVCARYLIVGGCLKFVRLRGNFRLVFIHGGFNVRFQSNIQLVFVDETFSIRSASWVLFRSEKIIKLQN